MRKLFISILILLLCLSVSGCGEDKRINGRLCETYGILNKDEIKCPNVKYKVIKGNVILGIVFIETIIAPIYFFGFSIKEPVEEK